jgi:DNA repair exonuclease SbcCD ATPase subunit
LLQERIAMLEEDVIARDQALEQFDALKSEAEELRQQLANGSLTCCMDYCFIFIFFRLSTLLLAETNQEEQQNNKKLEQRLANVEAELNEATNVNQELESRLGEVTGAAEDALKDMRELQRQVDEHQGTSSMIRQKNNTF